MTNPFKIEIFSTDGDPKGIRTIHKSNWSGTGIVFPKEQLPLMIKTEEDANKPGVYILVGGVAEETVYIGEADPVGERLKRHYQENLKDWAWGVFFTDSRNLGKTEIQFLEAELCRIAQENKSSIVTNKNHPSKPNMSRAAEAIATVFLNEMIPLFPLIGINAFSKPRLGTDIVDISAVKNQTLSKSLDTIVVPAKHDGFEETFLGENCWYAIRLNPKEIPKLKYIAAYRIAPISAITHIAEIDKITPYQDSGKYLVKFKKSAHELTVPITFKEGHNGSQPQGPRYSSYHKILSSKHLHDLW